MAIGTVEDIRDAVEFDIPAMNYVAEIVKADDMVSKKENKRPYTKLALKIVDTDPEGQDIDEDLFINPINSTVFTNLYSVLSGDNKFFANNATRTNKAFVLATGGLVDCEDLVNPDNPVTVGITVTYNKKDGQQQIGFYKLA